MYHSFDSDIAEKYGLNQAIILNSIYFWISHNEANGTNFNDGRYWTYNSNKAMQSIFPYLSKRKIEVALNDLKEKGLIITGNYNKVAYDRTTWYALTDYGKCIVSKCEMDSPDLCNGLSQNVKPIPVSYTISNTINKQDSSVLQNDVITYLNKVLNTNYKSTTKKTKESINARLKEGFTKEDFYKVIDKKFADWGKDEKMSAYLRPETLFGAKFESYLNQKKGKEKNNCGYEVIG